MEEVFVNKVAESGIITLDLEKILGTQEVIALDIKDQLFMGMILKEKDFRNFCKEADWSVYKDKYVAIFCSADAIIPTWAYMLLAARLSGVAKYFGFGSVQEITAQINIQTIEAIEVDEYSDKRVVIKGCSKEFVPESAYVALSRKLIPVVKSLMFGEPCSTVPVFKRP